MSKPQNNDVCKAVINVLEEFGIQKSDYEVVIKYPHSVVRVTYCGHIRDITFANTPSDWRAPYNHAAVTRRILREMEPKHEEPVMIENQVAPVVEILGNSVEVLEYQGQPVVTFAQIDVIHRRVDGTASRTFRENRKRFDEGIDFVRVCADEIRRHKIIPISTRAQEDVIFITKRGYLKLVKPLTDDRAWAVQGVMIDRYFDHGRQSLIASPSSDVLTTELTAIHQAIADQSAGTELQMEAMDTAFRALTVQVQSMASQIAALTIRPQAVLPKPAHEYMSAAAVVSELLGIASPTGRGVVSGVSMKLTAFCVQFGYDVKKIDGKRGFPRPAAMKWISHGGGRDIKVKYQRQKYVYTPPQNIAPLHISVVR